MKIISALDMGNDMELLKFSNGHFAYRNKKNNVKTEYLVKAGDFIDGIAIVRPLRLNHDEFVDVYGNMGNVVYTDPITKNKVAVYIRNNKLGYEPFFIYNIENYITLCPTLYTKIIKPWIKDYDTLTDLYNTACRVIEPYRDSIDEDTQTEIKKIDNFYQNSLKKIEKEL